VGEKEREASDMYDLTSRQCGDEREEEREKENKRKREREMEGERGVHVQ
jgi:hypothetical protein